jgi:hypothetical protein
MIITDFNIENRKLSQFTKKGIENIQKIEKQVNSNQVILADNNQKISTIEQMTQKTKS